MNQRFPDATASCVSDYNRLVNKCSRLFDECKVRESELVDKYNGLLNEYEEASNKWNKKRTEVVDKYNAPFEERDEWAEAYAAVNDKNKQRVNRERKLLVEASNVAERHDGLVSKYKRLEQEFAAREAALVKKHNDAVAEYQVREAELANKYKELASDYDALRAKYSLPAGGSAK